MSILIKGMEMPTEQYGKMVITLYPNGHVAEYIGDIGRVWEAVPVLPHGRLGDLDELERDFREDAKGPWNMRAMPMNWADAFEEVADIIADAPTIIPAEKEVEINFCGDCHWHEAEEQYCFRKGCHSYDESSCELWEPMPADEPIPAPGGKTVPTTYDLLYEEGGYNSNGV